MSQSYVEKWLVKASNDLQVAKNELNLTSELPVTEAICFHAQQAVEKFLKAYLVAKGVEFGKTHNLEYLRELCTQINVDFGNLDVGNLTFYATEVRYPDEFYTPSLDEARESVAIAIKVRDFVLAKMRK